MSWRDVQSLNIFAPASENYKENWVEQILGTTIKPIYDRHRDDIIWLWINGYCNKYCQDNPPTGCEVPKSHLVSGEIYRYIWFRVSIREESREDVQTRFLESIKRSNCYLNPKGWLDFETVERLGGDRYMRKDGNEAERTRRARLVANFLDATSRLMLDMLVRNEAGLWGFEANDHKENPHGSAFETLHHLFCNATKVPTKVLLDLQGDQLRVRTCWMNWQQIPLEQLDQPIPLQY